MSHIVTTLMLISLPIVFALIALIDRPFKESRGAIALDALSVILGWALFVDWSICAVLMLCLIL